MIFHRFQRCTRLDLPAQRLEFMVARLQRQAAPHSLQSALPISKVAAQFRYLQPDPGIVRFLLCARLGILPCLFQPSAVHQRHRITIIPCAAALRVFLRSRHPLGRLIVRIIFVKIIPGIGVPQGNLKVLPGLLLRKAPFCHASTDKIVQIRPHPAEVSAAALFKGCQRSDILL